jgi:hypothetical protein
MMQGSRGGPLSLHEGTSSSRQVPTYLMRDVVDPFHFSEPCSIQVLKL